MEVHQAEAVAVSADLPVPPRHTVLGAPVDCLTRRNAFGLLHRHLRSGTDQLLHVVTLNPEYVMAARSNPEFRQSISASDMIVVDGIGVKLALVLGIPECSCERLTGVELAQVLVTWSAFSDRGGLFLLGGADAAGAAQSLSARFPACRIAGFWSGGSADEADDSATIDLIAKSGADVVLVGYGAPDQVVWIERNRPRLEEIGVRVAVGVGGALDVFSGDAPRSPHMMQRVGLEWLYRLFRQPWRWKRQLVLPHFAILAIAEAARRRSNRKPT